MPTLSDVIERHGFEVLDHLDRAADIPFLEGLQFQGDTMIVPLATVKDEVSFTGDGTPVPRTGVVVVEAVGGGHEHRLFADEGACMWNPQVSDVTGLAIGVLTIPAGGRAVQAHEEHAYAGIAAPQAAPAKFVIRRQREQAGEERLVAD